MLIKAAHRGSGLGLGFAPSARQPYPRADERQMAMTGPAAEVKSILLMTLIDPVNLLANQGALSNGRRSGIARIYIGPLYSRRSF